VVLQQRRKEDEKIVEGERDMSRLKAEAHGEVESFGWRDACNTWLEVNRLAQLETCAEIYQSLNKKLTCVLFVLVLRFVS
jgi:hypothetical protein